MKKANELTIGESAIIEIVHAGSMRNRLLSMGCTPGTRVVLLNIAPFGCPFLFDIQGYKLALRATEAKLLQVVSLESATA